MDVLCATAACERAVYARGHCSRHYKQLLRHGELRDDPAPTTCAVAGCPRTAVTRGWCHGHYVRWSRTGDVRAEVPLARPVRDTCSLEGCGRGAHSQGMCRTHAHRARVQGDPHAGGAIRARTPDGGAVSHGYWQVPVPAELRHLVAPGRRTEFEHRLVMTTALGRPLTAQETVHHLNGDRLDNRLANLELWSSAQPKGQRVADKLAWAFDLIAQYDPEAGRALTGLGRGHQSDEQRPGPS